MFAGLGLLGVNRDQSVLESAALLSNPLSEAATASLDFKYACSPSCHEAKEFKPSFLSSWFSNTEYLGRGTFAGNSLGGAILRFAFVLVISKTVFANSYQLQHPSAVA